jgi:hypothetical protein
LKEKYIKNLQEGIFYADSQKVYYFVPSTPLDEAATYKLNVVIDEGRKKASAETDLVRALSVEGKSLSEELRLIRNYNPLEFGFISVRFVAPYREMLFSIYFKMHYDEYLADGSIVPREIVYDLGDKVSRIDDEKMESVLTGETFYSRILNDNHIKSANINNVLKRVVRFFSYTIVAGNKELSTYIKLNKPSGNIAQERQVYTNIEGGRGLFASKYSVFIDESNFGGRVMRLNKLSLQHLWEMNLKFCTDDTRYSASSPSGGPESFYCP